MSKKSSHHPLLFISSADVAAAAEIHALFFFSGRIKVIEVLDVVQSLQEMLM